LGGGRGKGGSRCTNRLESQSSRAYWVGGDGGSSGSKKCPTGPSCDPVRRHDGSERSLAVTGPLSSEKFPEIRDHPQQHKIEHAKDGGANCGGDRDLDDNFSGESDFHRLSLLLAFGTSLFEHPPMCLINGNIGFAKGRCSRSHMGGKPELTLASRTNLKTPKKNIF
jgi:hypothetical protein